MDYECRLLTGRAIFEAKRLQGAAYVRHGHLDAAALTPEGWLPWHDRISADRVRWFGAFTASGDLVAVARRIAPDHSGPSSLPAVQLLESAPASERILGSGSPGSAGGVVELSGVAKVPHAPLGATLHVYRALYRESLRCGDRLWVMSVVPALRDALGRIAPGGITVGTRLIPVAGGVAVGARAGLTAGEVAVGARAGMVAGSVAGEVAVGARAGIVAGEIAVGARAGSVVGGERWVSAAGDGSSGVRAGTADYPGVRGSVVVFPAWGLVGALTDRIRAVARASADLERRGFLCRVADFLDDGDCR